MGNALRGWNRKKGGAEHLDQRALLAWPGRGPAFPTPGPGHPHPPLDPAEFSTTWGAFRDSSPTGRGHCRPAQQSSGRRGSRAPHRSDPFWGRGGKRKDGGRRARAGGPGEGNRAAVGQTQASPALTVLGANSLARAAVPENGQRPLHLRGRVHVEFHSHRALLASRSLSPATAWNGHKRRRRGFWERHSPRPGPAAGQGGKKRTGGGRCEARTYRKRAAGRGRLGTLTE